jgi:GrpB-like predicted nucleotidyltransferase (UPF0157 family)
MGWDDRYVANRPAPALTKREVAARDWMYVQQCADAKTAVVREILARAQGGGSP